MHCKVGWTRQYMCDTLKSAFVNGTYSKRRGDILFDQEKAMFADTMPSAILAKIQKETKSEIARLKKQWIDIKLEMHGVSALSDDPLELVKYKCELKKIDLAVEALQFDLNGANQKAEPKPKIQKREYIRPCSVAHCRGYIEADMECKMCNTRFCEACHNPHNLGHICNDDDVASALVIMKDSKPCPSCHAMTFRMSGCPQMWCTMCKKAWNWRTGEIDNGSIHNPHYFQYLKTAKLEDIHPHICANGANNSFLERIVTFVKQKGSEWEWMYNIIRLTSHVMRVEQPKHTVQAHHDNLDLRIKFLIQDIDEGGFKRSLAQREKANAKKREISQILEMFVTAANDITMKSIATNESYFAEFNALCKYFNSMNQNVSRHYKSTKPLQINLATMNFSL